MCLRQKTIITIGLTFVGLVAVLYTVPRNILLRHFASLEEDLVRKNVQRVVGAIDNELTILGGIAADYGGWDDTYKFAEDRNETYIKANFADATFTNLRVDLVLVLNPAGEVVFAKGYHLDQAKEIPFPSTLRELLSGMKETPPPDEKGVWSGLAVIPEGAVLVTSGPILTSERQGPSHGAIVFGRFLDRAEIERFGKLTQLSLEVQRVGDSELPADFTLAGRELAETGKGPVHPLGDSIAGYAELKGMLDSPGLLLRVLVPRDVHQYGMASIKMLVGTLVIVGVVFGALILVLLERLVLSRVAFLSRSVRSIGASGDLAARIPVTGSDEVSSLTEAINAMLAELDESEIGRHESRRAMSTLLSNLPGIAYRARNNPEWAMEFISEGCREVTGYSPADFTEGRVSMVGLMHPDDRAAAWESIRNAIRDRKAFQVHYRIRTAWQSERWLWEQGRGVFAPAGELLALEGFITDITERKLAEQRLHEQTSLLKVKNVELEAQKEQLRAQQQELRTTNEALQNATKAASAATRTKSEFLANMSHEIRTPLTSIMGYADLLHESGDLAKSPPERVQAIEAIRRNGEHLLGIINDILDLSKIEAGRMTMERVPTSICGIVAEVASLVRVRANAKKLDFGYEYEGPVPDAVLTDPVRLRQVLINLMGNAVKFTDAGSVRLIVSYSETPTPHVQFDVVDTGVGMTPEQVTRIFDPFAQAEDSTTRRFGGTGLGLSICQRLVEMLGGEIHVVETQLGQGTRVRVTVAAGRADSSEMIADPASATVTRFVEPVKQDTEEGLPLAGCRVLLAEDGPDNQRLISHILSKAGAQVAVVGNGQMALDTALAARDQEEPFDVVLMDMQMPVMNGFTAVSQLRQKGYRGPIVALTAYAMVEDREKCLAAGCDDYASKPVNRNKLIDTIQWFRRAVASVER